MFILLSEGKLNQHCMLSTLCQSKLAIFKFLSQQFTLTIFIGK
jgi:hypothetical protein